MAGSGQPARLLELARMQATAVEAGAVCTTGLPALDAALGGGLPSGLTLLVGVQNGGKTTLANQMFSTLRALAMMERDGGAIVPDDPRNVWSSFLSLDMSSRDLVPMERAYLSTVFAPDRDGYATAGDVRTGRLSAAQIEVQDAIDAALSPEWGRVLFGGLTRRHVDVRVNGGIDFGYGQGGGYFGPMLHRVEYCESEPAQIEVQREYLAAQSALRAKTDEYDRAVEAEEKAWAALDAIAREQFGCTIAGVRMLERGPSALLEEKEALAEAIPLKTRELVKPTRKTVEAETRAEAEALAASDGLASSAPLLWLTRWGEDARRPRVVSRRDYTDAGDVTRAAVQFIDYAALLGHALASIGEPDAKKLDAAREMALAGMECRDWVNAMPGRAVLLVCQYRGDSASKPFDYDSIMGGSELVNAAGAIVVLSEDKEAPVPEQGKALGLVPVVARVTKTRRGRKDQQARLWFDGDHARFMDRR